MQNALETGVLPKILSPKLVPHPVNRLPKDIFIHIPCFFTSEKGSRDKFPMNKPLVTMTHVCRSWRDVLLSTPSLWTHIDFSTLRSKQAEGFLARSENQLLDIYQHVDMADHIEPFLPVTLHNIYRLRWLKMVCYHEHLKDVLGQLTKPAPELKHLEILNDNRCREDVGFTVEEVELPGTIFGGQFPKLATLSLSWLLTDLRDLNIPSLTRFIFTTEVDVSVQDLTSFFRRCPSLEFVEIHLPAIRESPIAPLSNRVCLAALKELRLGYGTCTAGLINHLALPSCTEVMLVGEFTGEEFNWYNKRAARIHPSSIDHLSVTSGITKAVAMPYSCILSGPNGNLRFRCSGVRGSFDAEFFTSFSPISVLDIRELWVGQKVTDPFATGGSWNPTTAGIYSAFGALTKVEDLTIVSCKPEPFFSALATTMDDRVPLPRLRRLTVFFGRRESDVPALIQCAKTRKEHSRPLGEVAVVFEELEADSVEGMELLREFVGESICRVGAAPKMFWMGEDYDDLPKWT